MKDAPVFIAVCLYRRRSLFPFGTVSCNQSPSAKLNNIVIRFAIATY